MNEAANRAGLLLRSVFHQTREYQPRRSSVLQLPSMTDISTPGANSDCVHFGTDARASAYMTWNLQTLRSGPVSKRLCHAASPIRPSHI
jgi:hypothetical protein